MKKEILILAKSIKRGQHCVAGREIIRTQSRMLIGEWIRPVSDHDEGAISSKEALLEKGGLPHVLDIIQVELKENAENPTQPENWLIDKGKWKKTGKIDSSSLFKHFIETPNDLWISDSGESDRVATDDYLKNNCDSSIVIIRPDEFVMKIYTEYNPFKGYNQKKRRGIFLYNGINYNLSITDPEIDKKYFNPFPGIDDEAKEIVMDTDKCLLCISLTPEFQGSHYKLIATIIENE